MNARTLVTFSAASLFVVFAGARAQAQTPILKVEIPFAFTAGLKEMPAGTYDVMRPDGTQSMIEVRGLNGGAFALSPTREASTGNEETRLVFDRYDNKYFLRAVWFPGEDGYALPETKAEHEYEAGLKGHRAANAEVVSVVAALR